MHFRFLSLGKSLLERIRLLINFRRVQKKSSERGWVCSKRNRNASPHTHDFGYSLGRVKEVEHMETWKLWFIVFLSLVGFWALATWLA
jgi:hypothetical protein